MVRTGDEKRRAGKPADLADFSVYSKKTKTRKSETIIGRTLISFHRGAAAKTDASPRYTMAKRGIARKTPRKPARLLRQISQAIADPELCIMHRAICE